MKINIPTIAIDYTFKACEISVFLRLFTYNNEVKN